MPGREHVGMLQHGLHHFEMHDQFMGLDCQQVFSDSMFLDTW